jgi:glycine/D-amino acid oxidase-like deaminating enzyme
MAGERAVVIGAGVIGSAIALELARAGWATTLLDRGHAPGHGSTAASSAVVRFTYSTVAGTSMAYEAAEWWRHWADHVRLPATAPLTQFVQSGMVFFDDPSGAARASMPVLEQVGVVHEWWDVNELRRRLPHLATGSWFPPTPLADPAFAAEPTTELGGALFTPEAGYVTDPQLAAQNLADAAMAAGATLRMRAEVVAVERGERVAGVRLADGERVAADVVVNAAGPHSGHINTLAGVLGDMTVGTRPLRQQVAHVRVPAGAPVATAHHPVTADIDGGIYFRPDHQAFLVGGVEADCDPLVWLDDADDVQLDIDADEWDTHVHRLARRIPALGVPHTRRGVVGVYDVSDDWMPILDRTDLDGFYVAVGSSGNQFKNAPVIGHCMARLVAAVESGYDHDRHPLVVDGVHRRLAIDLGTFSRRRAVTDDQRSRGVLG